MVFWGTPEVRLRQENKCFFHFFDFYHSSCWFFEFAFLKCFVLSIIAFPSMRCSKNTPSILLRDYSRRFLTRKQMIWASMIADSLCFTVDGFLGYTRGTFETRKQMFFSLFRLLPLVVLIFRIRVFQMLRFKQNLLPAHAVLKKNTIDSTAGL